MLLNKQYYKASSEREFVIEFYKNVSQSLLASPNEKEHISIVTTVLYFRQIGKNIEICFSFTHIDKFFFDTPVEVSFLIGRDGLIKNTTDPIQFNNIQFISNQVDSIFEWFEMYPHLIIELFRFLRKELIIRNDINKRLNARRPMEYSVKQKRIDVNY